MLVALTPVSARGACDFTLGAGVERLADGRYAYSTDCHKAVGKLVLDAKDHEEEKLALRKTIDLKDLGLKTQEQRAQLWMDTSLKLEDRVTQMEQWKSTNQWIFFGLGVLTTGVAAWAVGQAVR